ncbi:MAG TPA: SPFH domain-containing protein [Pyrinomonadaceae bacterium]|nr:SPFH/Band 7/PHB domain protein [Chloracidobacterium sp.]MBP9936885.1 SPFH/Band 7/PHB domain protein [Pyrinomonadaceae bacterium]MBK9768504.1 SPFH/Band 7/PHB domain protein [Chloracidobacterium sp.]MBL0239128.1 SPFH/Band 7/PHB domain protein [Chloracidobacterium sp.]HQX56352.1 SPFH domain-containing protein [Pyrinomonadaceae bacterium]
MELFGLGAVFLVFLGIALLTVAWKTIKIVPQSSVLLIERLGRFHRVANSGLNIIVPFFEAPRAVYWSGTRPGTTFIDLREQFIDMPPQPVITRDNVTINVDSVVYWQITEPMKSVYEVADLVGAIVQLTITGMRSVMGDMDLDHTLSNRDQINGKLRLILDEATDKWGVKVTRVDVKNINPPEDVRITMEKQMTAERNRRALILQAEGDKQAAITRAEGEKQAAVTRSEGNKQSAILDAEGAAQARLVSSTAEAQAIAQIAGAIGDRRQTAQYLITSRYVDSMRDMARTQNSKVIFMPMETSGVLASVGAFKEIFAATGETPELPKAPRGPRELEK